MNQMNQGLGQMMTLEQWNHQVELQQRAERKKAGVLCGCGTEMVCFTPHPAYNISHGNPNCLCHGEIPNVLCPACGVTGRKR